MFKLFVSLAVAQARQFLHPLEVEPSAGSIGLKVNMTSAQHVADSLVPLFLSLAVKGQTIKTNIVEKKVLPPYKFELDSVTIANIKGPMARTVEQVKGTNDIHVTMGKINATLDLDAKLSAAYFIPFIPTSVDLTDLTIDFTLTSTSDDKVHWALKGTSEVTLGDFDIKMKSKFFTTIVSWSKWIIKGIVNKTLKNLPAAIDAKIAQLNDIIANEGPNTFDLGLFGKNYPLNMTMTKAPSMPVDSDLLTLNFDGTFHDPVNARYPLLGHGYFPDIVSHRE